MYNQIWTKILDSSIWLEDTETRIVWITFLAMMDKNGMVRLSSIGNVANRARVSVEAAQAAIDCLSDPDVYNPDQEHEGRRIERIPGEGWRVINKDKYQKMMTAARIQAQSVESSRAYRERKKESVTEGDTAVTNSDQSVTLSESEAESNTESESEINPIDRRGAVEKTEEARGWIRKAVAKYTDVDPRAVESSVIETLLNRPLDAPAIRSVKYFEPEILRWGAIVLSDEALDSRLVGRRLRLALLGDDQERVLEVK